MSRTGLIGWEPVGEEVRVGVGDYVRAWGVGFFARMVPVSFMVMGIVAIAVENRNVIPFSIGLVTWLIFQITVERWLVFRHPVTEAMKRKLGEGWDAVFSDKSIWSNRYREKYVVQFRSDGMEIRGVERRVVVPKGGDVGVQVFKRREESVIWVDVEDQIVEFAVQDNGMLVQRAYEGRFLD